MLVKTLVYRLISLTVLYHCTATSATLRQGAIIWRVCHHSEGNDNQIIDDKTRKNMAVKKKGERKKKNRINVDTMRTGARVCECQSESNLVR